MGLLSPYLLQAACATPGQCRKCKPLLLLPKWICAFQRKRAQVSEQGVNEILKFSQCLMFINCFTNSAPFLPFFGSFFPSCQGSASKGLARLVLCISLATSSSRVGHGSARGLIAPSVPWHWSYSLSVQYTYIYTIYIYIYLYLFLCMYVCMCVCMYVYIYIFSYSNLSISYFWIYIFISMYIYNWLCVYEYKYIYIYIHNHI